jgi:small subunit ribosomal protein S9
MANEKKATVKTATTEAQLKVAKENFYGTGKRKNAIAKVWLFTGEGVISINDKSVKDFINNESLSDVIMSPLQVLGLDKKYNVKASTNGGGIVGQATAIQLGIARALVEMNQEFRKKLKEHGFLTRDPRVKERKKYGRKKARKGYQFRKR